MGSSVFDWTKIEAKPTPTGSVRSFFKAPTATLDELECHVTTLNPGTASHPAHKHANEELIIVREGTVEVLVNGELKRVGPGSGCLQRFQRHAQSAQRGRCPGGLPRHQLVFARNEAQNHRSQLNDDSSRAAINVHCFRAEEADQRLAAFLRKFHGQA